jgi:hypothetical protein
MPSTVIRRFAFRPDRTALDVEFVTGRVYRYFAVPEGVARGLAGARSKGSYFNRTVRDRFHYVRLRGWEPPEDEPVPPPAE